MLQGDLRSPASGRQIVAGHLSDWAKRRHWQECRLEPSALWCFEMRWVGDIYTPLPRGGGGGMKCGGVLGPCQGFGCVVKSIELSFDICLPAGARSRRKKVEVEHARA